MMIHSESLTAMAAALAKAQADVRPAIKDSENPHFRSRYADLAAVWDVARPALAASGLSLTQWPGVCDEAGMHLTTLLLHTSGEWMRTESVIPLPQPTPQGYGSALTYLRRYALAAILGIAQEDDDAAAASSMKAASKRAPRASAVMPLGPDDPLPTVNRQTGEVREPPSLNPALISEAQRKRFYAIWKGAGWQESEIKDWLAKTYGVLHSKDIRRDQYEAICAAVEAGIDR